MEDDVMEVHFGRGVVRENLERAVSESKLLRNSDGSFSPSQKNASAVYLHVKHTRKLECSFLNDFLFTIAYDKTAVPYGCRNCYKVKIVPANFKGLIALRGILEKAPFTSKCGVDFFNPHSQDSYAGFLYLDGLDAARSACGEIRPLIDTHPDLGASVRVTIKRGCSNMEAVCGPSDKWIFREGMAELESALRVFFKYEHSVSIDYRQRRMASMLEWMQIAYNLRDDSYLSLTGGRPLHKPTVSYPVEDAEPN